MQAVGTRYRKEVTELGLGFAPRDMVSRLLSWGIRSLGRLARNINHMS